jgi:uncharacterized SAM-dependent methyltransferase
MQVNDLIFKELIKRGYTLDGKTRVWNIADSKLWYLTPDQAQAYLDLEESENYKSLATNSEFELFEKNMPLLKDKLESFGAINVVDLGCGDGKKAEFIINKLGKKFKVRYCPIDISGYMVEKAIETLSKSKVDEIIEFQYNISDFENLENLTPLLSKGTFKKSLFLLLGYTLGNFEIHELLYAIRSSMNRGDVLMIVSGIASEKWQQWINDVKDPKKLAVNSFFIYTPLQLGLSKNDLEFGARYKNSRVEYFYTLMNDKKIQFQDKTIYFNKGDQIIVAVSYKHEKQDLLETLNMHFDEVSFTVSKDKSTFLALCQR